MTLLNQYAYAFISSTSNTKKGENMTLELMNTSADKRYLSKSTSVVKTVNCKIKEGTSIINPTVIIGKLSASNIRKCNYAYISEFGRYYFINDIIETTANQLEISMHVDVLKTYSSQIRSISTLILRQENVFSPYYEDKEALVRVNRFREKKNIGTVGGSDTNYYLTVNNGGV